MAINDSTQLTQDTTVTAQYAAQMFTVTIVPNGGSGSNKTYSVAYGTNWSVPSSPFSRTGYNFNNYKTGASSGTSYSAGNSIRVTRNITLYCQWSAKTYTVTIYPNGASGSNKTYSVAYGTSWSIPSCPFSRSGYSFNGYRTSSSSGTSYNAGSRVTITSNFKLYCQWGLSINSVSLTANSGSYAKRSTYTQTNSSGSGGGGWVSWRSTNSMNITLTANMDLTGYSALLDVTNPPASNSVASVSGKSIHRSYEYTSSGTGGGPGSITYKTVYVKLTSGSSSVIKSVAL